MTVFLAKMAKTRFLSKSDNVTSVRYYAATLCKNPEQTYERILRSSSEERTDERTDKSEFVGPNSAPRGTKNVSIIFKKTTINRK